MSSRCRYALVFDLLVLCAIALARAQDIPVGVTSICSGEHIYVENCKIRDTSDASTRMSPILTTSLPPASTATPT